MGTQKIIQNKKFSKTLSGWVQWRMIGYSPHPKCEVLRQPLNIDFLDHGGVNAQGGIQPNTQTHRGL